jgi:hypothetical protein
VIRPLQGSDSVADIMACDLIAQGVERERVLAIVEAVLAMTRPVAATEQGVIRDAPKDGQDMDAAEIEALRLWAAEIDFDRLLKHLMATGYECEPMPTATERLRNFCVSGRGSYHLRNVLKQVRADLADYA